LFNREIQDLLEQKLLSGELAKPLDLIGFDACLMSMLETAYALRHAGTVMVGSEELEPGFGWSYDLFLEQLVQHPESSAADLAKFIVQSYKKNYQALATFDATTTLSAVDLSRIELIAVELSGFADDLRTNLASELRFVKQARDTCKSYAPSDDYYHVDLIRFLDQYASKTQNAALRSRARGLSTLMRASIVDNYAGTDRDNQTSFGSNGIAIYFPRTGTAYRNDYHEDHAYQKLNNEFPVAFVSEQTWADFLHLYFSKCLTEGVNRQCVPAP
jgi:hypothetical protein